MNKKIFSLIIILICFIPSIVKADLNPVGSVIIIEDAYCDGNLASPSAPSNQQSFYEEELDRWYIIYPYQVAGGDFKFYYSYTDSGNITAWTNGGECSFYIFFSESGANHYKISYYGAWAYDNENNLGHLVYCTEYDIILYQNFTANTETGALTFGETKTIHSIDDYSYWSIDISLSHNNLPIVATTKNDGSIFIFFADSINGYSATWVCGYFDTDIAHNSVSVMPTGNTSVIIITNNMDTPNPIKYRTMDSTSITNGTTSISISEHNGYRGVTISGGILFNSVGITYNSTHGCIGYTGSGSPYTLYAIIFDFETITTNEYTVEGLYGYYPSPFINENEFFMAYINHQTSNMDLIGNEYHNPSYDSYFNSSASELLHDDFGLSNTNIYGVSGGSRMTDINGNSLYIGHSGDNIAVLFYNGEGEYPYTPNTNGNGNDERPDPFDWSNVKYIALVFILLLIVIFAIYVKHGGRR